MRRLLPLLALSATVHADIQNDGWQVVPQQPVAAPDAAAAAAQPPVPAPPPNWAVAAMLAIDPRYADGIVVVTGRGGTPEPKQWVVVARDDEDLGTLHKLTVAGGQVIADVQSLNAYEALRQDVSINPVQVQVDSGDAFLIVENLATAAGLAIDHVDYALTVRGTDAAPLWTLNCFGPGGRFLGKVTLLATTGTVLAGFPHSANP